MRNRIAVHRDHGFARTEPGEFLRDAALNDAQRIDDLLLEKVPLGFTGMALLLSAPETGLLADSCDIEAKTGLTEGNIFAAVLEGPQKGVFSVARTGYEITDGAFLPDGRHIVLRTYTRAVVHAFPSLEPVGAYFEIRARHSGKLLTVYGIWQRDVNTGGQVTNLVAERIVDHTALLGSLQVRSRDFR